MKRARLLIKKVLKGKKPLTVMLHSVDDKNDSCTISSEKFMEFVECFEKEIRAGKIILTFDDGFESVYSKCFPFLKRKRIPFVCFLVSDFLNKPNYLSESQIFEMMNSGLLTIGSHGKTHAVLDSLSYQDLREEIFESKSELEQRFNVPVHIFAYSHGIFNKQCIRLIKNAGYQFGYVASANVSDFLSLNHYITPRYNLKEETFFDVTNEIRFYEKKSV